MKLSKRSLLSRRILECLFGFAGIALSAVAQTTAANDWTWIQGSSQGRQPSGVYGQMGLPAASNTPGGRQWTISWTDENGNPWLFGGEGFDSAGSYGILNDVWEFNTSTQKWVWMAGSNTVPPQTPGGCVICAPPAVFGTYQTPGQATTPGGIQSPVIWTDKAGNLWLFSGVEDTTVNGMTVTSTLNALWEFNVSVNEWAWMGGSNSLNGNTPGVYGTLGQPAVGNTPGGRSAALTWTDTSGSLWLFGGHGLDSAGNLGYLNDLWIFSPSINQWTWMGGSNLLPASGSAQGVYGTFQVPAPDNIPLGRSGSYQWTDKNGNVWLFGGVTDVTYEVNGQQGIEGIYLNDLWEFNSSTHQWAWMGGSNTFTGNGPEFGNYPGVYGTLGTPSATSIPGARSPSGGSQPYTWTDTSNNLWLFGGVGYDSTDRVASLNDVWKFDPSIVEWAWMGGSSTFSTNCTENGSLACVVPGVYGTLGVPAAGNVPGARIGAMEWTDRSGNIWFFGGTGVDSVGTWGDLNDLWEFNPSSDEWTWMGGNNTLPVISSYTSGLFGMYGTIGVQAATNMPGGRQAAASWTDGNGNAWLFGGYGCSSNLCEGWLNDLWEYSTVLPNFYLSGNSGTISVPVGGSATSVFTTTVVGGFDSVENLTATGQPNGVTVSFNPSSITGAGQSTMTITAGPGVTYATYPITVSATSGSVSKTITMSLVVTRPTPAATPTFSPAAGNYISAQSVTISDTTPSATIYYTIDGTTPTTNSTPYSGPITVSSSELIKAIAVATTYPNSAVATGIFTLSLPYSSSTFLNPYPLRYNGDPVDVLIADVNGDGFPDMVYQDASTTPETIHTLLGQGGGGYLPGPTLSLPSFVGGCRTLDANHDGRVDLACLNSIDEYDIQIVTFLGNGDGTFQAPIYSGPMQSSVSSNFGFVGWLYTPADVNGDGFPDLFVGDSYDEWVFVLLGDGTGRFTVKSVLGGYPTPQLSGFAANDGMSIFASDINGDGKPDLVLSNGPTVMLGNGDGTFAQPVQYGLYDSCVLYDMEGDGHADAVCGASLTTTGISAGDGTGATELAILHGNADGSFNKTPVVTKVFGNPTGGYGKFLGPVGVFDLNGDGIPDILAYSPDGLTVLLGQSGLNFSDPVHYATGFQGTNGQLSTQYADMNQDGLIDVVSIGPNGIYISYGKADGTFNAPPAFEVADVVGHITVADFNGDGVPDIAATGDQSIELSLGNGDGTFKPFTAVSNGGTGFFIGSGAGVAQIVHGDFRGNGKQDIFAIGSPSAGTYDPYVLFGNGDGTFGSPQLVPSFSVNFPAPSSLSVLDINKDGRDDILTTDASHIYAALSNGDGTFTTVNTAIPANSYGLNPSFPAFADFNLDGKLDSVYGQGSNVSVLKGHGDGTFDTTGVILTIPDYQGIAPPSTDDIAVTTGDFDGDGKPDIAVIVQFQPGDPSSPLFYQVASIAFVYYGNGDGTFSSPVLAGVFDRLFLRIYSADLKKNGLSDLILQTDNSLGVVLSLPGRTFSQELDYNGGSFESELAIADLNGDGYPDLLVNNSGFFATGYTSLPGNSVTELLNVGGKPALKGLLTPTVTLTPASSNVTTQQALSVTVVVSGGAANPTPTGIVAVSAGSYTSTVAALAGGSATVNIPAGSLSAGNDTLLATYTTDSESSSIYNAASGASTPVTVTPVTINPTLTLTPSASAITSAQALSVMVAVSGGSGNPTPTGSVTLTGGGFTSSAIALSGGNATINVPANSLAAGADTLTVTYSPYAASSSIYVSGTGTASVTVTTPVPPSFTITGPAVTVSPGATTGNKSTITLTPAGGFTGNVALTASVTSSPTGAQYPPTLSFGSTTPVSITSTTAGTATLTITTTAATSSALSYPKRPGVPLFAADGAALACILLFGIPARRRGWRTIFGMLTLLVVLTASVLACGGGGSGGGGGGGGGIAGTTVGIYTITVTGTAGATTGTGTVTLTVQ